MDQQPSDQQGTPRFRSLLDPTERDAQCPASGFHQSRSPPATGPHPHNVDFPALADRSATEPDSLSVTFRHSGWLHNRGRVAASLSRTGQTFSRRQNFSNCGARSFVLRSVDNPDVYRIAGSSCHDRFCLPCAKDRSQAVALNVTETARNHQIRFLTLTLKASCAPLADQLDRLYESFQALRRRSLWTKKVTGGVAFLEVTWSSATGTWHPHFHVLIEGSYLHQPSLKKLWYQITKDSFVVDIRAVRDNQTAARYVTKYASKPFNNTFLTDPELLDEAVLAFKGRKLLVTFGSWRGILLIDTPSEGSWDHVADLETVIINAAHGDPESRKILQSLTDADLTELYCRAPPAPPRPKNAELDFTQFTFFGAWQASNSYFYPS